MSMNLLINDTDFKQHVRVSASYNFDPLQTHINNAQRSILIPLIGKALFDALVAKYNLATPGFSDDETELLTYIHPMLANLGMFKYAASGNVMWTDSGAQVKHSGDMKSAFQWQVKDARRHFLNTGYESIELMLTFLDDNAAQFTDYNPAVNRTRIINTVADFRKSVHLRRYEFELIKPVIDRVERNIALKYLGKPLYDAYKVSVAAYNLSPEQKALTIELQAMVAHISYSQALLDLSAKVDEDGIHFYNDAFSGNFEGKEPINPNVLNRLIREHKLYGDQAATNLTDFLNANTVDYPLFESSDYYEGNYSDFDDSESVIVDL